MFLKDNKYKDVIIAVLITFTFCIIIYKAFDILGPGITYFFKEFVSLSMPFVYGIVIAYILSPVVRIFERRLKLSNGISIALTYAVFLGIIFVLCIYGIPSLIDSIKDIASNEKEEILEVIGVNNIKDELELEKIEYKVIKEKDNLIKYCCTISDHGKSIMVLEQIIDKYNK